MEALILLSPPPNLPPLQIHQLLYLPLLTFSRAITTYALHMAYIVEVSTSYEISYYLPKGVL